MYFVFCILNTFVASQSQLTFKNSDKKNL